MAMEALAQFRLQELPRRRMRQAVDEHDIVRHLPFRQFVRQEIEERLLCGRPAVARLDDQQRALLPDGVCDRDDGGFEDVGVAARVDQSLPVGNEGAGIVIKAGSSPEAKRLVGKAVAMLGGAMYAQYRLVNAADALVLPNGATPTDGASCFVNPLTSLGMTETMRREGHTALVHTAAASNLGQMLNKICIKDKIPLVNIVRNEEQAKLLRGIGATYICNSTAPTFMNDLTEAVSATGATIAFDAIGGGKLASQILSCMEAAAARKMTEYSRYGSSVFKQVYIYGGLDTGPTELTRSFGLSWSVSGWLLMPFLTKIGPAETQNLRDRVARELKTTFASHYTKVVSLQGALKPEAIAAYAKRATGEKYLINPSLGA